MIIVTGGAGFIGSALLWQLNNLGIDNILVVDRLGSANKWQNLNKRAFRTALHKDEFLPWLERGADGVAVEAIFHLGASSSTTETNCDYLMSNNVNYSIQLWRHCTRHKIPFIYASSAATYGDGSEGFSDDMKKVPSLRPLNPYGFSKQKFDHWVSFQTKTPPFWAGLKFFNVYGPQEYHKGGQASVIPQFVPQVQNSRTIKLFKSYRSDYAHGAQRRDFVYVKDCVKIMAHLYRHASRAKSGLYNIGSGEARSFAELAQAVFKAMDVADPRLDFIEMPEPLRAQYQYHTMAELTRLREFAGYTDPMTRIEDGVADYVRNYLLNNDRYL
ncbi:MAG: ADP-glyceromanno-heptose 6-epimerase [Deltaproteobacteria bacterium]|nr:ADP-glyceromanno-heptose 6-epimerase [Deltaproteobacteria bacterium]